MSRRKDRERYLSLKEQNPDYVGFRGADTGPPIPPPPVLESAVCSICGRTRNVPADSLPPDLIDFVCIRCQEERPPAEADA